MKYSDALEAMPAQTQISQVHNGNNPFEPQASGFASPQLTQVCSQISDSLQEVKHQIDFLTKTFENFEKNSKQTIIEEVTNQIKPLQTQVLRALTERDTRIEEQIEHRLQNIEKNMVQVQGYGDWNELNAKLAEIEIKVKELQKRDDIKALENKLGQMGKQISDLKTHHNTHNPDKRLAQIEKQVQTLERKADFDQTLENRLEELEKQIREEMLPTNFTSKKAYALFCEFITWRSTYYSDKNIPNDQTKINTTTLQTSTPAATNQVQDHFSVEIQRQDDRNKTDMGILGYLSLESDKHKIHSPSTPMIERQQYREPISTIPNFSPPTVNVTTRRQTTRTTDNDNTEDRKRLLKRIQNIPKFHGKIDENWHTFIHFFERSASKYTQDSELKAELLGDLLTDTAADYFTQLTPCEQTNYEILKPILEIRFSQKEDPRVIRRQLNSMKQQPNQSNRQFADKINELVNHGFVGASADIVNQAAVDAFLQGTTHKSTAWLVANQRPTSLNQAVQLLEEALINQKTILGDKHVRQITFQDETVSVNAVQTEQNQYQPQSRGRSPFRNQQSNNTYNSGQSRGYSPYRNRYRYSSPYPRPDYNVDNRNRSQSPNGRFNSNRNQSKSPIRNTDQSLQNFMDSLCDLIKNTTGIRSESSSRNSSPSRKDPQICFKCRKLDITHATVQKMKT